MRIENFRVSLDNGQASQERPSAAQGASFSELLAQAVAQESETTATPATAGTNATGASTATTSDVQTQALWGQVDSLLTALDNYASALGDPNKTLKDLEPLANDLEQQAQSLEDGLGGLNQEDLGKLAMQALTQAKVEAFKFQRGDYVQS